MGFSGSIRAVLTTVISSSGQQVSHRLWREVLFAAQTQSPSSAPLPP
jgi:hypothetical protein